jgi:hypothetical protein
LAVDGEVVQCPNERKPDVETIAVIPSKAIT